MTERENGRLGVVSIDVPLLSNLTVIENLTLIRQFHENLPFERAAMIAENYLSRARLLDIADLPIGALNQHQTFCVMFLRALMVSRVAMVIVRPALLMPGIALRSLMEDMIRMFEDAYTQCMVLELEWHGENLRVPDAQAE